MVYDKDKNAKEVYEPMKELKNKFYQTKTQEEWDACKEELKAIYDKASKLMDKTFYEQYRDGVNASILKMYEFKKKYFEQGGKKQYQPKVTYLLQDELAQALTEYIKLKTAVLASEYEGRLNIEKEKNFC